jgi:hypothetical protein
MKERFFGRARRPPRSAIAVRNLVDQCADVDLDWHRYSFYSRWMTSQRSSAETDSRHDLLQGFPEALS